MFYAYTAYIDLQTVNAVLLVGYSDFFGESRGSWILLHQQILNSRPSVPDLLLHS